ncbi:alpha/beta fold hydrolase [Cellulomonas sp.]|uniref:alpha/beta fold hydrolase n=1 Tax=Cellulomonas sp. TaxID=40001 RepID=UPI0025BD1C04|nr:alpha/beta fold hydrolase [Cellulomonas sp.]
MSSADGRRAPASLPPAGLPGLDPAWSRLVDVPGSGTWHVLDNRDALPAEPVGTILCVHGNPTWSYLWRRLVAAGARADRPWRVVAVDQLGMGFSERDGRVRRLEDRVADLGALTKELGLEGPVVTAGHDWGGVVSLGWAAEHRDVLAGVVLLNTAIHLPPGDRAPAVLRPAMAPGVRTASTVTTTAFLDTTLALAHPTLAPDVRAAFRAPYRTADRRQAIGDFVADIPATADHPSRPTLDRIAAAVSTFDVPALLLWGARDPVFSDRFLDDLSVRLPHADVHRSPRAGHLVGEDEDLAGGVLQWLDARLSAASPQEETPVDASWTPLGAALADRQDDDGPALVELHGGRTRTIPWSLLATRVDELARGLVTLGVQTGDRVAVLVPPGGDLTAVLYACLRIGAVVVVADAGLGVRGLSRAVRSARPAAVVGIERALVAARALGWSSTLVAAGPVRRRLRRALGVVATLPEVADLGRVSAVDLPTPGPGDEAAVLFTSGSTGPAKGAVYTQRGLSAMRDAVGRTYGVGPDHPFVAAFAPFALLGPALGATTASPDMDVTAPRTLTARALADAVRAIDGRVVFASPAALAGVLATQGDLTPADRAALAEVTTFLSAGAPVPERLLAEAAELLPRAALHTPYGMTEMLPVTDIDLAGIRAAGPGDGVCVGRPVAGADVRISALDADGCATGEPTAEPGVVGEVLVSGPHRKVRYDRLWLTEQASSRDPGAHRTGDVGHLDAEGRLWVEGRLAHVVVTADGVVTPVGVEQRVDEVPGVVRSAGVGVGPRGTQQLVVVVEPQAPAREVVADEQLAAAVRAAVAPLRVAAVLVAARLPTDVRHNSKIDRAAVAAWADAVLAGRRARL